MGFTHEQIERAIEVWQKRLRLQDWTFQTRWDEVPDLEGALADVAQVPGRKLARLRFAPDQVARGDAADVSETIAHELLHIVLEPMGDVLELTLEGASNERIILMQRAWNNALELATDALAKAFAAACGPPDCLLETDDAEAEPLRVTE